MYREVYKWTNRIWNCDSLRCASSGVTGPFNISYSVCRLTGIRWGIWFLSYFSSDRSCRY